MTTEEKAKAYDEALERVKKLHKDAITLQLEQDIKDYEYIFPELAESEDEKIRKKLIFDFQVLGKTEWGDLKVKDILAWLEKQGETSTILSNSSNIGNVTLSEEEQNRFAKCVLTSCASSFIDYLDAHKYEGKMCVSNGECEDIENAFHNAMWDRLHRYYCKYIEKQGEQKQKQYDIDILEKHITKDSISELAHTVIVRNGWEIVDAKEQKTAWLEKQCDSKSIWHNEDEEPKKGSLILLIMQSGTPIVAKIIEPNHTFNHGERWAYIDDLLEKQGAQKPAEWHSEDEQNLNTCLGYIPDEFLRRWLTDAIHAKYDKPADKTEPKFKVGDWVIDKQGIVHQIANVIEIVTRHTYGYDVVGGGCFNDNTEGVRLWTIQDAKDGDVLCVKYGNEEMPFIFNGKQDKVAYCALNSFGEFVLSIAEWLLKTSVLPATKEQRALLFQKMNEAGYEWDAELKKVSKITTPADVGFEELGKAWAEEANKQNLANSAKTCKKSQRMISAETKEALYDKPATIDIDKMVDDYANNEEFGKPLNCMVRAYRQGLKDAIWKVVSESAWSEEDEEMLDGIILRCEKYGHQEQINWLKSIKQRIKGE